MVLCLLLARNALLLNQYLAHLATRGTTVIWTDALDPLLAYLETVDASRLSIVDWGYSSSLCVLSSGRLPLQDISFSLQSPDENVDGIRSLMADTRNLFVEHAEGCDIFPQARERLASISQRAGYVRHVQAVICDRNRRPRFEVVRYGTQSAP